jgi:hypothetical protein
LVVSEIGVAAEFSFLHQALLYDLSIQTNQELPMAGCRFSKSECHDKAFFDWRARRECSAHGSLGLPAQCCSVRYGRTHSAAVRRCAFEVARLETLRTIDGEQQH